MSTYRQAVEDHLICCLLIETLGAVEAIEEICAVPGIDLIVPALFDLTTALGVSGQFDHPEFLAAVARIERAAIGAGVPPCGAAFSLPQAEALLARGSRMICGFDMLWLRPQAAEMPGWLSGPTPRAVNGAPSH
jgi:4-hydroxy-2-oxoheptanedioate aldolase